MIQAKKNVGDHLLRMQISLCFLSQYILFQYAVSEVTICKGAHFSCPCPIYIYIYISNYLEPLKCVNICITQNPYINLHFTIVKLYCGVRTKYRKDLLCVAFGLYFFTCVYIYIFLWFRWRNHLWNYYCLLCSVTHLWNYVGERYEAVRRIYTSGHWVCGLGHISVNSILVST
jgi:hypothetical protein